MMNNNKSIIALVLGMALTACASTSPVEKTTIQPIPYSEVCCTTYSEFPWIKLSTNEELDFQIDESSPIGHFSDGNSYFNAFKLSERSGRVQIKLSSIMSNGSVFAPKLLTLDSNFNIVNQTSVEKFDVKTADAFTRSQYQLNFLLDAKKTPYFIIYTPESSLGNSIQIDHPAKVRAKELGEAMPMVTDPRYVYDHFGKLELELKTLSLASYKEQASPKAEVVDKKPAIQVQPDTQSYYFTAIETAVASGDIPKALSLLDEAKALNIKGAQEVFVKAVNAK